MRHVHKSRAIEVHEVDELKCTAKAVGDLRRAVDEEFGADGCDPFIVIDSHGDELKKLAEAVLAPRGSLPAQTHAVKVKEDLSKIILDMEKRSLTTWSKEMHRAITIMLGEADADTLDLDSLESHGDMFAQAIASLSDSNV